MVSIKDIADHAGVSVATVSRVINNKGYISDSTREKVLKYVEELNYIPNEVARSLNNKSSKIIGLLVPSIEMVFFSELVYAIESAANKYDYKILLCNSEVDADKEKSYVNMLKRNQVAGIIMASQNMDVDYYKNINYPIVMVERFFSTEIPYVISDNYNGGVMATTLLIEKGCKYIGHLSGYKNIKPAQKRTNAFEKVCKQYNVPYIIEHTQIGFDAAYEASINLLRNNPDIDGVFCSSDEIALAMLKAARELDISIPDQLKIVGYDGTKLARFLGITTICQPIEDMGRVAIELLLEHIKHDTRNIDSRIFSVTLCEGATT